MNAYEIQRQGVGNTARTNNAMIEPPASSREKEHEQEEGVLPLLGKRRLGNVSQKEPLVAEPEIASKTARLGEGNRPDAEATETDSDQSEGEIDDENQNKSAYLARFSKRSQASKCIDLVHDTMPCKDAPSPEIFMNTARKLEQQVLDAWTIVMFSKWISQHFLWCADAEYTALPSSAQKNSWKVAMDLDHVPWKSLCKTYGLTLDQIAPPRMNAEGQPVERFDVWLLKGSNQVRCGCLSL